MIKHAFRRTPFYPPVRVLREALFPNASYRAEEQRLDFYAAFYRQFFSAGDLVFDIGANYGHRTRVFRSMGATVVAVEPQQICASYLRWKLRDGVHVEQVAVADKAGLAAMYPSELDSLATLSSSWIERAREGRFPAVRWSRAVSVPTTTLDLLIAKYGRPAFCKIDVEAYEPQVVAGLSSKIPSLAFEYMVPENHDLLLATFDRLATIDPDVRVNYSPADTMQLANERWCDQAQARSLFASPAFMATGWGDVYVRMSTTPTSS